MAGGKMWQDVDNHGIGGTHGVLVDGVVYQCSSTHHQMMIEGPDSVLVGIASPDRSSYKTNDVQTYHLINNDYWEDVEIVYHPKIQALSFQPHPEFFQPDHECQVLFFSLINKYLA